MLRVYGIGGCAWRIRRRSRNRWRYAQKYEGDEFLVDWARDMAEGGWCRVWLRRGFVDWWGDPDERRRSQSEERLAAICVTRMGLDELRALDGDGKLVGGHGPH